MNAMTERYYHLFFRVGVILKAIATVAEIALGILLYAASTEWINGAILVLIGGELSEAPQEAHWRFLLQDFHGVSPHTQYLWAFLLLSHGLVKVLLVGGLLKERLWAYPASAIVFAFFVVYQIQQSFLSPSIFLDILTALDIILIGLILHEYRYKRRAHR